MDATSLPAVVVTAFFVSLATVIIPSPSTLTASRFGVAKGTRAAIACLTGVVLLDVLAFVLLALGFQPLLDSIGGSRYIVEVAGFLLVGAGIVSIIAAPQDASKLVSKRGQRFAAREQSLHGPFIAGVIIPIANPGYWIWWTTVGTAFIHTARKWGRLGLTLVFLAFLTGVLAWYIPLLLALHHGRQIFSPKVHQRLLTLLGIAMIGFGVFLIWETFFGGGLQL